MAFNATKFQLLLITYRKSTVIKNEYNMYQANALSDNISSALALLAEKYRLFSANHRFYSHKRTQLQRYLCVIIDNELGFSQHIVDMTIKATNLLNSCRRYLHTCSKDVKNSAYNMIVCPHCSIPNMLKPLYQTYYRYT